MTIKYHLLSLSSILLLQSSKKIEMESTAEPIVSQLDRLDIMLRHLEEMKGVNAGVASPRSSHASTEPSSGTLTTTTTTDAGGNSSTPSSSPNKLSLEKRCRPIEAVIMETQAKGTLIVRLALLEDRLLKVCMQLEEEMQEKKREEEEKKKKSKKGLRGLVRSCVGGGEAKVKHP